MFFGRILSVTAGVVAAQSGCVTGVESIMLKPCFGSRWYTRIDNAEASGSENINPRVARVDVQRKRESDEVERVLRLAELELKLFEKSSTKKLSLQDWTRLLQKCVRMGLENIEDRLLGRLKTDLMRRVMDWRNEVVRTDFTVDEYVELTRGRLMEDIDADVDLLSQTFELKALMQAV